MGAHKASVDGCESSLQFDVYSPHAFLDAFVEGRGDLQLGLQHDAREALEEVLTQTGHAPCFTNVVREGSLWHVCRYVRRYVCTYFCLYVCNVSCVCVMYACMLICMYVVYVCMFFACMHLCLHVYAHQ